MKVKSCVSKIFQRNYDIMIKNGTSYRPADKTIFLEEKRMQSFDNQMQDWVNPDVLSRNREPARSTMIPYENSDTALTFNRGLSGLFKLLNGDWLFSYYDAPMLIPKDFFERILTIPIGTISGSGIGKCTGTTSGIHQRELSVSVDPLMFGYESYGTIPQNLYDTQKMGRKES